MAIRDISEVLDWLRYSRHTSRSNHCRRAFWQSQCGILSGRCQLEYIETIESGWDWLGIFNSAGRRAWDGGNYSDVANRAVNMRGHRVVVGDISGVQGESRGSGDEACGDVCRRTRRKPVFSFFYRSVELECIEKDKPCGDRIGIGDSLWFRNWGCELNWHCEIRKLQMRGNGMEVGNIGAVFRRAWLSWYPADCCDFSAKKW